MSWADGVSGWVVYDSAGQMIRRFNDTNGDNTVDQWSYFNEVLEIYRDDGTKSADKKPLTDLYIPTR